MRNRYFVGLYFAVALSLAIAACSTSTPEKSSETATAVAPAPSEQHPAADTQRAEAPHLTKVDYSKAVEIDEAYRRAFLDCDNRNAFRELTLPFKDTKRRQWFGCSGDPNRLTRLVRFPSIALVGDAVAYTSKLGVDYDGSWVAANTPGMTDLKDTSLELKGPDGIPVPTDSDSVNFVVMPNSGPTPALGSEFKSKTGVTLGDVGVVLYHDQVVPVIVADGGPFNKIGEGSMALHRALGVELCLQRDAKGTCTKVNLRPSSIGSDVTTIIFTKSAIPHASAGTVARLSYEKALQLFEIFKTSYGSP